MSGNKYQSLIESSSIQGANANYVEAYYEQFLEDPESSTRPGGRTSG